MPWPIFLPNQVIFGSMKSNVAVICGWTTKEKTLRELEEANPLILQQVAAIGNLYSAERGIDMVIRNILAHPYIDTIVFTGRDISGASNDFMEFIKAKDRGMNTEDGKDAWYFNGTNIRIGGDIPEDVLLKCRNSLCFYSKAKISDAADLVAEIHARTPVERREPRVYTPLVPEADSLPAPASVHPIRVDTISDGYLELLYQIMTFGHTIDTHYDQRSKELMNLIVVIEGEPPQMWLPGGFPTPGYKLPEFIPFDRWHLETYIDTLLTGEGDTNVSYRYGHLMRFHFGVDQMKKTAQKLAKEKDSRSAVIGLWDPKIEKSSPCLNHIWFRIVDDKLYMTCVIRSNDMLYGWPENAYGMRALQEWMRLMIVKYRDDHTSFMDDDGFTLGDLTIISQSAHIYEDGWAPALDIVEKYRHPKMRFDPKGNFFIEDTGNPIGERQYAPDQFKVQLVAPTGEVVFEFTAPSTSNVRKEIDRRRLISDVGHALWVGYELGKMDQKEISLMETIKRQVDLNTFKPYLEEAIRAYKMGRMEREG